MWARQRERALREIAALTAEAIELQWYFVPVACLRGQMRGLMDDHEAARKVVFPSVDDETVKFYNRLGEDLQRRAVQRREEVPAYYR